MFFSLDTAVVLLFIITLVFNIIALILHRRALNYFNETVDELFETLSEKERDHQ